MAQYGQIRRVRRGAGSPRTVREALQDRCALRQPVRRVQKAAEASRLRVLLRKHLHRPHLQAQVVEVYVVTSPLLILGDDQDQDQGAGSGRGRGRGRGQGQGQGPTVAFRQTTTRASR